MNSIQYKLNKRYRIEIQQKTREYYNSTEHIRKKRVKLRNMFIPTISMKNGICEYIYPNEFLIIDAKLEKLQDMVWDNIFKNRDEEDGV